MTRHRQSAKSNVLLLLGFKVGRGLLLGQKHFKEGPCLSVVRLSPGGQNDLWREICWCPYTAARLGLELLVLGIAEVADLDQRPRHPVQERVLELDVAIRNALHEVGRKSNTIFGGP